MAVSEKSESTPRVTSQHRRSGHQLRYTPQKRTGAQVSLALSGLTDKEIVTIVKVHKY